MATSILFVSDRNGANHIYLMQYDGTNQRALTGAAGAQDYNPSWAPDGQRNRVRARHRDGNGFDIFVMNIDGSNLRQLTTNPAQDGTPTWSPDGNTILFRSDRDGNNEVYSHACRWLRPASTDRQPDLRWQPDLRADRRGLRRRAPRGESPQRRRRSPLDARAIS